MRHVAQIILTIMLFSGCTARREDQNSLRVGVTPMPHEIILRQLVEPLKREGVQLKLVVYNDYVQPNTQLAEGQLDANFYQTLPYLENFNAHHKTQLAALSAMHIEPMGIYSRSHKKLADIPDGAVVALPSDAANSARALQLLAAQGLLALRARDGLTTVRDVSANPRHLRFKELDGAMLPRVLGDVDAACINTNFALAAALSPTRDALALESKEAPQVNVVAVRAVDLEKPMLQKLKAQLTAPEVRSFIATTFGDAVLPAF